MCNLETEGFKFGCGHYVAERQVGKIDCLSAFCLNSVRHPKKCPFCPRCERYYGPDAKEIILDTKTEYCTSCEYWLRGPGSRPHPKQPNPAPKLNPH